ncbi:zinc-binding alcohol dehydrogenase family protein [Pyxidicoccus fallax]|uniref:Zinc-type alcohol dehydrogenase-like protein n=1 Tax=Pyxidicoccus fallax TaxID=394095 RepID=A0A848L714_9BACT|nr:zinc-binding alcohol dehydrogenase family protein [Pyxidicoccus fallax]NMO14424.1 zinc-binding alcohol dehydrogenase family protein [Pyxidicoccus fallax]NPC77591.1 zinc-binding alcohol dehydrogenase family protein [Pyxidicoccus fallax]
MKAIAYRQPLPIEHAQSLIDVELPTPKPTGRDLLVRVEAISVNPVDVKVRAGADPKGQDKVLGWDAAGTVLAVGPDATLFKPGDEVFYAGSLDRPGTNSEQHLVDERIVGRKPKSLSFAEAAALPLTSITAWELLFDRLGIRRGKPVDAGSVLILGGAGGVGSIAIQLARRLTGLNVIATASRPETQTWVRGLGAHHVVDHRGAWLEQVKAIAPRGVEYVLGLTHTEDHFDAIAEALAPQGALALIDDPAKPLPINKLKAKSASLHWEFMFTRSRFQTPDMIAQHHLLNEVADLVDSGVLHTTLKENLGRINAANLKRAHALLESGRAMGKVVLSGF